METWLSGHVCRYSHVSNGKSEFSCNKYRVCLPYDDLLTAYQLTDSKMRTYERALYDIVEKDAEIFEYKTWAKEALKH